MREIKFRAWDLNTSRMVFFKADFEIDDGPGGIYFPKKSHVYGNGGDKRYKLMQYTGLKDKNGKDIYEGDIVTGYWMDIFDQPQKFVIKWGGNYPAFDCYDTDGKYHDFEYNLLMNDEIEWEIVGNIYENPELIEVKK